MWSASALGHRLARLYRLLLTGQGRLLQAREQRILETVTSKGQ
jgi:hypothetical protein